MDKNYVTLDKDRRLSQSLLWRLGDEAYNTFGPRAWTHEGVPFYLTSNPYTANIYSQITLGYLRDCLDILDRSAPVYIFDLGAGLGRFAFLFLKHFIPIYNTIFQRKFPIKYVLTDMVASNLEFCKDHSLLKPYFDEGILEVAYYRHDVPLAEKKEIKNPVILFANYFFDSIPHDLFLLNHGKLKMGKVTLKVPKASRDHAASEQDPRLIKDLNYSYAYEICRDDPYPSSHHNEFLHRYAAKHPESVFSFPCGGLQSLDFFFKLSNNRLLLISGDQGMSLERAEPKISLHGTFSIDVNYDAMSEYFCFKGGKGKVTTLSEPLFQMFVGIMGNQDTYQTDLAFAQHLDSFEPKDYWKFSNYLIDQGDKLPLDVLIALIKLGRWDPINFHILFPVIHKQLHTASPLTKQHLRYAIQAARDLFYPVTPEEGMFVNNLGVLCFVMKDLPLAKELFTWALAIAGKNTQIERNLDACKKQQK